jgi:hypothetical protein
MIFEHRLYTDDKGRKVMMKALVQIRGEAEATMGYPPEFFGRAYVGIQRPGGPVQQYPVEFPIKAMTIAEAFELFERASLQAHEKTKAEIDAARIAADAERNKGKKRIVLAGPGHVPPIPQGR